MRITHRRRPAAMSVALLALALTAACTTSEASPQPGDGPEIAVAPGKTPSLSAKPDADPAPIPLSTARGRKSGKTIAIGGGDSPYNYAPSVLLDAGRYRMWWCSQLGVAQPAGDDILLAESPLDGRPVRRLPTARAPPRSSPAARARSTPCTPATRR